MYQSGGEARGADVSGAQRDCRVAGGEGAECPVRSAGISAGLVVGWIRRIRVELASGAGLIETRLRKGGDQRAFKPYFRGQTSLKPLVLSDLNDQSRER